MQASPPLRAAIYTRVSSDEQTKGYGLEYQREDCKSAVARDGHAMTKEYSDPGVSGTLEQRPGLNALRADAQRGCFDVLYVWKSDRLARDEILQLTLYRELKAHGIEVRSVTEPEMNDLMRGIYAVFGAEDLRNLKSKMYSGRLRAVRDGKWIGSVPYGYTRDRRTLRLKPHPAETAWLRRLFTWFVDDRMTLTALATRAHAHHIPTRFDARKKTKPTNGPGFWSKGSLGRLLRRDYYATGTAWYLKYRAPRLTKPTARPRSDWIRVPVPPLITQKLFAAAQYQLKQNLANSPRRSWRTYLFAKRLVCGYCERRLTGVCRPDREAAKYYRANAWVEKRCPHCRHYLERDLEQSIWPTLTELLQSPARLAASLEAHRALTSPSHGLENELKDVASTESRLTRMEDTLLTYELEGFFSPSAIARKRADLRSQRQKLEERKRELATFQATEEQRHAAAASAADFYQAIRDHLRDPSYETKRRVTQVLVEKIVLRDRHAEVWLNIPINDSLPVAVNVISGAAQQTSEAIPLRGRNTHTPSNPAVPGRLRRSLNMTGDANDATSATERQDSRMQDSILLVIPVSLGGPTSQRPGTRADIAA